MTDLKLNKPALGTTKWHKELNANFEKLEKIHNEGTTWKGDHSFGENVSVEENLSVEGNLSVEKDAKDVREVAPLEQIK